ncbi:MAG: PQQ-binding-like beta-propeller repeat protein [Planctomycetota bacterium]
MSKSYFYLPLLIAMLAVLPASGDDDTDRWTGFRNEGTNISTASELPVQWSPESGIAWERELPGYGQSAPLLWDGKVYLTAVRGPMKEESVVIALDAKSGETIWEKSVSSSSEDANYYAKSRAAPTPVVDELGVYAFFEGGDVVGISHDGKLKWQRSLTKEYGEFENGHGLGSSLAQTENSVIVLIDHRGPSYLLAVDKKTGENRWKTDRESRSSWSSPVVADINGVQQVVISSNGTVDSYKADSGEQLWSVEQVGGNTIPSVTVVGNQIIAGAKPSERGGESEIPQTTCCISVDAGQSSKAEIAWRSRNAICHYASPLVVDGLVYSVNNVGVFCCTDLASGETLYRERTAGMCWATPMAADGHIYLFGKDGKTTVIQSGKQYKEVAVNDLWDMAKPPTPETYVQHAPQRSGGSFADRIKAADKNGDGNIEKDEMPDSMKRFFDRMDSNSDGMIGKEEIRAMEERSRSSSNSYGDPIVYGAAAGESSLFIRTGTRIYCVKKSDE